MYVQYLTTHLEVYPILWYNRGRRGGYSTIRYGVLDSAFVFTYDEGE